MIKYLGSKRTLLPVILEAIGKLPDVRKVTDLFSGTARVGHALKAAGYAVRSNDHNAYSATLARCYVEADAQDWTGDATQLAAEFNGLRGEPGYFTETFCEKSWFFQPENGARVDAIREAIARKHLPPELESIMLVSLMEAADRVDSTTGVQMAYLKQWAKRSHNVLALRVPALLTRAAHGKGEAHQLDAVDAAKKLDADVVYLDPPYNQHSYLGNYHVWESLVRWDKPEVYGKACKRIDVKQRQSIFNSRPRFAAAFEAVLRNVKCKALVISFNNEGYLDRTAMENLLADCFPGRSVVTIENDFKRYVGAQIGIHDLTGKKVGKVSHLRNKEFLYVVAEPSVAERIVDETPALFA